MDSALKPCPFCGGAPEFENTDERARLRCTGCGTEGGLFFFSQEECESGIGDETEGRAIAAWNLRALPAPAGEPEMPEPVAYFEPDNPHNSMAFAWPGSRRMARHASGLYTADQLRAYGDARAEHARRVAMEDAALIVDAEEDNAREERYHPGLVGALSACAAAIRAAAPPQREQT